MLRRLAAIASLAVLGALSLGAAVAHAVIAPPTRWDVSIAGKQTVKWSFAAERPPACTSYYGTAGEEAKGSGTVSMSFATAKKKPIGAETYLGNNKLRFSSFNTVGWTIPATYSKQGSFSVTLGKPCGWVEGDPEPLGKISDTSDCGTERQKMDVSLEWSDGEFVLGGGMSHLPWGSCPGVVEQGTKVLDTTSCTPKDLPSGIEGDALQGIRSSVSASKFTAGKKFTVEADKEYNCSFPSTWPGSEPLKVDLVTSYRVTFKPRG